MKKTRFLIPLLSALVAADFAYAGQPEVVVPPVPQVVTSRYSKHPYTLFFRAGVMHTDVDNLPFERSAQSIPSLLYGCTLGSNWNFQESTFNDHTLTHSMGFSVGYYGGVLDWNYPGKGGEFGQIQVDVVPLTLAYDVKYELTDSISVFAGLRTGAMVRTTTVDFYTNGQTGSKSYESTKVLPKAGCGVGVELYLAEQTNLTISYDFEYTFGQDADVNTKASSMDCRYYGTVNIGVSYSF